MNMGLKQPVALLRKIKRRLGGAVAPQSAGAVPPAPSPSPSRESLIADVLDRAGIFDAAFYRRAYLDVDASGLEPVDHFVRFGLESSRRPSIAFDPVFYAERYPDVGGSRSSALHYAYFGQTEGRTIGKPPFDPGRLEHVVAAIGESGLFDADFYAAANPAVADAGMDPLLHYLTHAHRTFADPSASFSTSAYLARHFDVRQAGANPLVHWLDIGRAEGRVLPSGSAADFLWMSPERPYALPDDVMRFERMAGIAFFAGQGFDFADRQGPASLARTVASLAACVPTLTIERQAPKVSIIVPVYGQTHFVLNCLDSLSRHASRHSVEIIVADDASPDDTQTTLLAQIPWIRYERRASNGGFLVCCNSTVDLSKGEFVVLLNSDTRVVDGWLDELIDGFSIFPKAGMTGSKLFNDDGSLQEAGGIFWRDGSAHNYGRGDDPDRPQYCHARQADFISGASIAVPRKVWNELGGFDELYRPAYCEDADLAFRVRRAGYEVWFVPGSRVIHYEGVTHGRDTNKGIKAYQVENLKKFAKRFAKELHDHPIPGTSSVRAASWRSRKHMLIADALTPRPDQDSGSIVTDEVMRTYREKGFDESFFPFHEPLFKGEATRRLQRRGVCCHYVPYSPDVEAILGVSHDFDYALLYRYVVAGPVSAALRRHSPSTRVLFANVDLHYLRESRAASTNNDASGRFKAEVTKSQELEMFARADASFVHTDIERKLIEGEMPRPLNNLVVLPWLSDVRTNDEGLAGRDDIMFLGNFPHEPNVDSIKFFMSSIWPTLESRLPPHARLLVVGNKPPPEVMAMATDRVIVTGYVEDLEPYFASSRVFVAPLRYGAGIKGKLVMALAHGVPSVATTIAAEGIGSSESAHLRVADAPAEFADEVLRVYADESLWSAMRAAGWRFVQDNYSSDAAAALCAEALDVADRVWLERQDTRRRQLLRDILVTQHAPAVHGAIDLQHQAGGSANS
ncbi:glycosyltransferase [Variovorax sp. KK3]|uniref:glycosyltransferase n=1 Tax=Variovorax sp. KK3 TaxID=1855728 RepID=UPI00097C67DE|nr:glycosyltransferase [Variovorax sp. KK3]